MSDRVKTVLLFAFRLFLGGVFAAAGWSKVTSPPENFQAVLAEYKMLPMALTPVLSVVVPWVEWVFGMFLIFGFLPRFSAAALSMMCLGFVIVLAPEVFSGRGMKACGCFGGAFTLTASQVFALDAVNLANGLFLTMRNRWPFSVHELIFRKPG